MQRQVKHRGLARILDLIQSLFGRDVPVYAANAAYFIILAVFPMTMLILNLLSYTTMSSGSLLDLLATVVPEALMPLVTRILSEMFQSSSTTLVSVSALAALWAASRGVFGILVGLNRVYGVTEDRGYVYTRLLSLVYTFLFLVVLILTLALHVFGQTIMAQLPQSDNPMFRLVKNVITNRYLVLLVIQSALFLAMYMFLPNRRNKLLPTLPGALLASLGWQLFSNFFSMYAERFSNYDTVYGGLSVVAMAMMWLYICVAILFYCGAINKYLCDIGYELRIHRQKKTKEDEEN